MDGRGRNSVFCVMLLLLCAGCGAVPSTVPAATSAAVPDLSGDWHIQNEVTAPGGAINVSMDGFLVFQGSQVTGTFRYANLALLSSCPVDQVITVAGSVDAKQVLTLTSAAFSGYVVTAQLTLPASGAEVMGSLTVTGTGACAQASTAAIGFHFGSQTGSYVGTLTALGSTQNLASGSANVTLNVVQATSPGSDGRYGATGTLQFSGGSCTTSVALSGFFSGLVMNLDAAPATPYSLASPALILAPDPSGLNVLEGSVVFYAAPCSSGSPGGGSFYAFGGRLTKQ